MCFASSTDKFVGSFWDRNTKQYRFHSHATRPGSCWSLLEHWVNKLGWEKDQLTSAAEGCLLQWIEIVHRKVRLWGTRCSRMISISPLTRTIFLYACSQINTHIWTLCWRLRYELSRHMQFFFVWCNKQDWNHSIAPRWKNQKLKENDKVTEKIKMWLRWREKLYNLATWRT